MKTTLLFMMASLILLGCAAKQYYLGMTQAEFLKHNSSAQVVSMHGNIAVYRITKTYMTMNPGSKFYYFQDGKLFQMDEGRRATDFVIEHRDN